ncbi:MAG TPA: flagellar basal body-associated FliL family protein [Solirubrobacteraceae bacterium]|jgi:flagellar FliL protein|nr:flagellar basal body-associated FliL family protein [Solirubrobacteraceae bacterium]
MNKKLLIIPIVLLVVLGGAYKTVLAKPAKAPKPKVDGTVYVLGKEFLVNLKDGRFAKLTAALVLAHDDTSTAAAGGEAAPSPPEGYGAMTQEAVVRAIITDDLTNASDAQLIEAHRREELQKEILKDLKRKTDVKVEDVLFPDVTVQ